jgi:hypothetical protein
MANMSAAEMLKAELSGAVPVKPNLSLPAKPATSAPGTDTFLPPPSDSSSLSNGTLSDHNEVVPGFGNHHTSTSTVSDSPDDRKDAAVPVEPTLENDAEGDIDTDEPMNGDSAADAAADAFMTSDDDLAGGVKRKLSDVDDTADETLGDDEDDAPPDVSVRLKVNSDGTVDQEDTVQYVVTIFVILLAYFWVSDFGSQDIKTVITTKNSQIISTILI